MPPSKDLSSEIPLMVGGYDTIPPWPLESQGKTYPSQVDCSSVPEMPLGKGEDFLSMQGTLDFRRHESVTSPMDTHAPVDQSSAFGENEYDAHPHATTEQYSTSVRSIAHEVPRGGEIPRNEFLQAPGQPLASFFDPSMLPDGGSIRGQSSVFPPTLAYAPAHLTTNSQSVLTPNTPYSSGSSGVVRSDSFMREQSGVVPSILTPTGPMVSSQIAPNPSQVYGGFVNPGAPGPSISMINTREARLEEQNALLWSMVESLRQDLAVLRARGN